MGERESKPGSSTLELSGETAVRDAANAARAYGCALDLGDDDRAHICIVVEELVANLYEHGNLAPHDRVGLCFSRTTDGVVIVLTDPGTPFDPRQAKATEAVPARGGGAGINLVKRWATRVTYAVEPDRNRLELLVAVPASCANR